MKIFCEFLTSTKALFAFLAILSIALIVWVAIDINDRLSESENIITVSATSEVYAKPDLALTTFSVVTEAKTVGEAMADNTAKMNAVIASVKSQGVEDKDLKTTNFNISPRYEWYDSTNCPLYASYCYPGQRVLVGYEVTQSLQVKIRDLAKVGDIVQGATEAGANEVGDLQFTIDNEDLLKEEARGKAIEEAKTKAEILAGQLGIRLVKIISFSENGYVPYPLYAAAETAPSGKGGGVTLDIQTGENKISVMVSITYQIR